MVFSFSSYGERMKILVRGLPQLKEKTGTHGHNWRVYRGFQLDPTALGMDKIRTTGQHASQPQTMRKGETMNNKISRRHFLSSTALAAGAAAATESVLNPSSSAAQTVPAGKIRIIALNGSPRKDKTTVAALTVALGAAQAVSPDRIEVELVHLADYNLLSSQRVLGSLAIPTLEGKTDFIKLEEKLSAPEVRGLLVGSPTHNSTQSSLVTLFFGQVRHGNDKNGLPILEGKPAGALAVGGGRNGGQENVVNGINTYFFHEKMILVGTDAGRVGALLWNQKDSIEADDFGKKLAVSLGQRVAKAALSLSKNMFAS